jgi:hypothetical protein
MSATLASDTVVLVSALGITAWLVLSTRAFLRRSDEQCRLMSEVVSARVVEMLAENERETFARPLEDLDATGELLLTAVPEPAPEPVIEPVPDFDRADPFIALKELAAKYRDVAALRDSIKRDLVPALA